MKKYILKSVLALCAVPFIASCSLDEYDPLGSDTNASLTEYDKWYGMQAKCYEPIYGRLYPVADFMQVAEGGTDLWLTPENKDGYKELFYYESLVPFENKQWDKAFTQAYSALGLCTSTIKKAEAMEQTDDVKTLYAEARFLRGFYHLMLTTYYGPITLVTNSVEDGFELTPKRNTLSEIYTSVVKDLEYAMNNLDKTPYQNNRARASKKSAVGMLCRAYVQAAGQGLTADDGTSYWQKAADLAADFVADTEAGGNKYGGYLYDDISEMWAQANNRTNKEALFVAAGIDSHVDKDTWNTAFAGANKLFAYCYWNMTLCQDISKIKSDKQNYLYGRTNSALFAPSKYLLDLYNASWDKRWETSFQTAFGGFSMVQCGWRGYDEKNSIAEITEGIADIYKIDRAMVGQKIYPYADCDGKSTQGDAGGNQYEASVWPKGETSGDVSKLIKPKNVYVMDYPAAKDDNRIFLYLSKEKLSEADKVGRRYACVNIDDLFDKDGMYWKSNVDTEFGQKYGNTNPLYKTFPCLTKFSWNYDGVFLGSNLQVKNGDIFVMRAAEVYLIAAEAYEKLGNGTKAAEYINKLRKRAARSGVDKSAYELATATESDVLDEYARELCGEHQRWAVLQRHQAFQAQLNKGNKRAAATFQSFHKWRPMSQSFLQQIDNAEEYGDNGYGTTANSGLDGFEK